MNLAELPLALSLLLPGFLLLHVIFLVSRIRRISAFHATTWSLLISFLLFIGIYALYTAVASPPSGEPSWASLRDAITDPYSIPGGIWIALYTSAVALGWVIGKLEVRGVPRRLLLFAGIDLSSHGGIWERAFQENDSSEILVYMRDGSLLLGWPKYFSNDRSDPGPEVYLSPASVWDSQSGDWVAMAHADGVLLHGSEISRIEFLKVDSISHK